MSNNRDAVEQSVIKLLAALKPCFTEVYGPGGVSVNDHAAIYGAMQAAQAALDDRNGRQDEQESLRTKIQALENELRPYREAEERERIEALRSARLTAIVDILFPKYDSLHYRNHPDEKPLIHPERDWWWNGAKIISEGDEGDGFIPLEVESYVGGGQMDALEINVPVEWLKVADLKGAIHAWIESETARKKADQRRVEIETARRQLEEQQKKLAALEAGSNG